MKASVKNLRSHALKVYLFSLRESTVRTDYEKTIEREKERALKNSSL